MSKVKLSVMLVIRNEYRNIRRCLEALRWVDEIVVVDQSSDDGSVGICKEFTDKVYIVSNKGFCEPDRITAASYCTNEWLLSLDADEVATPQMQQEIVTLLAGEPQYGSYYLPHKNIFLDTWIRGSGWYPSYGLRLFRKDAVLFSSAIHSGITAVGHSGYLKEPVVHYTADNLENYLGEKFNRYTGILARQAYQRGVRITRMNGIIKLFLLPCAYSFKKFILQRGFRDGLYGVVIAISTGMTIFIMNIKIWELQQKKQPKDI